MNVNTTVAWICATAIILTVLGGIYALAWHDKSVIVVVLPIIGAIATAALSIFGVHAGVSAGAKAAKQPTSSE